MFCPKTTNAIIKNVHMLALRVLLNDYDSSFKELLHRNEELQLFFKPIINKFYCYLYYYYYIIIIIIIMSFLFSVLCEVVLYSRR